MYSGFWEDSEKIHIIALVLTCLYAIYFLMTIKKHGANMWN